MALLEVQDIHTYYGHIHALRGVSLTVEEGEIVTLIGGNGAGKSTTLNTISGVTPARHGQVILDGMDITRVPPHDIVGLGITQAPEGRRIFARLTVQENLDLGAYSRKDTASVKQTLEMVYELFPRLKERRNQPGGTLSGGEQQMLAIGRAMMAQPRILLLDEPSMGLAPILVQEIFEIIQQLNAQGTTILLVEQNAQAALSICTRGYVLQTGEIVLAGPGKELLRNEMVRKAYLGEE
ncbi:MAG TPA: ABC transporter ATP-binding protein [Aggregatilineales bacterium]|nr:ABC transporter ATP-binding protein [Chloroflexota bacterium]HOA23403.1 ABC transporter ATP-binding protein [Aggregatilineales bacterium]HPV08804.1 ABC transporter ATP-binding protein [Aggregatilineales bacterium]HQA67357.1 ABC transporter ATP-binding protein [Aggregatilineales bacterium]HQE19338.1 ABC transporter ATP-binding protein [Aggregatilineales bacterium]